MAWIEKKERSDGVVSAYVTWRLGDGRAGAKQVETFSVGSSEQNIARAEGFKKMVEASGQRWPAGWVKGEGFVRRNGGDPMIEPPRFPVICEEYVRQIVDITPGQRRKYLSQVRILGETEIRAGFPFARGDRDRGALHQGVADRLGPVAEDEGELPRTDVRRLQLHARGGLHHGQPVPSDSPEASPGTRVPGGVAVSL